MYYQKKNQIPISQLVNSLPKRFTVSDRIQDYPMSKSRNLLSKYITSYAINRDFGAFFGDVRNVELTDGLKILFDSENSLHIRASGNAPELRIYIESFSTEQALVLLKKSIEVILKK